MDSYLILNGWLQRDSDSGGMLEKDFAGTMVYLDTRTCNTLGKVLDEIDRQLGGQPYYEFLKLH